MIRHVVAFRFRDDLTEVQRQSLLDELARFPSMYPAMRDFAIGQNISKRDQTFTHAFSMEFTTEEQLISYLSSERHERFVSDRFRPSVAARAIVSFEAPTTTGSPRLLPWHVPVRAVIFDMDGLLVDTGAVWRRVGDELFAALGVDVSDITSRGVMMGMRVADASAFLKSYAGFDATDFSDLDEKVEAAMIEAVDDVHLKPGALSAIDFCDKLGLSTALASGSTMPIIEALLERFGLTSRFQAVCSASDDPVGKPHPALFLRAAGQLGVPPDACAVLEDAVSGCIAGKAAGMRVIAVPDGPAVGDPRFAIADIELSSLEEIDSEPVLALLGLE